MSAILRVAMALSIATAPLGAQNTVEIVGDETYCSCIVTLQHVVTLGDTAGSGMLLGEVRQVRRDAEGIYHVLAWNEHQIYRFTPDGRALPSLLNKGEGPGEALQVDYFQIVADSLVVFDSGNARMTVLDPEGEEARTMPLPSNIPDAEYLPGSGVVLNARGFDASSFGRLFHVFDMQGRHVRSFGGEVSNRRNRDLTWVRNIAERGNAIWAAPQHWYEIERWALDGDRTHTVKRQTDWFEPRLHGSWGGPDEPMKPWIPDIAVDARGYIRVLIIRGGPRWAELLPAPISQRSTGDPVYPVPPGIGLFESVLEILDPDSGRLVARGILEPELFGFVDPEHVFSYHQDEIGRPTISIWRLGLSGS